MESIALEIQLVCQITNGPKHGYSPWLYCIQQYRKVNSAKLPEISSSAVTLKVKKESSASSSLWDEL
jgi:hypothetical protein